MCVCTCTRQSPCLGASIDGIRHSKINGSRVDEFFCFHSMWTGMTDRAAGQIASHCSFLIQADHTIFCRLQCRLFVGDKESIHCYWFGPCSKNADLWVSWYKGPNRKPKWAHTLSSSPKVQQEAKPQRFGWRKRVGGADIQHFFLGCQRNRGLWICPFKSKKLHLERQPLNFVGVYQPPH